MPITEHQRSLRHKHIGSSDVPAILGISPWKTRNDVYWEKVTPPETQPEATAPMQMGNFLEGPLLEYAAAELGVKLLRNQFRVSPGADGGILAANFDALVQGKRWEVEAKYIGPNSFGEWGEPGTDEVPTHVAAQVQEQMYVGDLEIAWIPVFVAGFRAERRMYRVPRDPEIIGDLVGELVRFWQDHVIARLPPDPSTPPPLESLVRRLRNPGSVMDLPAEANDWVELYEEASKNCRAAEETKDGAKRALLAMLGDAESGRLTDGRLLAFRSQNGQRQCNLDRLQREHPDIYQELVYQKISRHFRILKGDRKP